MLEGDTSLRRKLYVEIHREAATCLSHLFEVAAVVADPDGNPDGLVSCLLARMQPLGNRLLHVDLLPNAVFDPLTHASNSTVKLCGIEAANAHKAVFLLGSWIFLPLLAATDVAPNQRMPAPARFLDAMRRLLRASRRTIKRRLDENSALLWTELQFLRELVDDPGALTGILAKLNREKAHAAAPEVHNQNALHLPGQAAHAIPAVECKHGEPNKADTTDKADTKADTQTNFVPKMPDSPDVADLCRRLQKAAPLKRGQAIEIAREFTRGNNTKAENLLRQARRFRHLWAAPN